MTNLKTLGMLNVRRVQAGLEHRMKNEIIHQSFIHSPGKSTSMIYCSLCFEEKIKIASLLITNIAAY